MDPHANRAPVRNLIAFGHGVSFESCAAPSITSGSDKSKEKASCEKSRRLRARQYAAKSPAPKRTPRHLEHSGSWYPLQKKLRAGD